MVVTLGRGLPEGVYDPLEASSPEFADPSTAGEFRGGIGVVVIVRYSETPVGKTLNTSTIFLGLIPNAEMQYHIVKI